MEPNWEFSAPQFRDFTAMGSEASEDSDDFFRVDMETGKVWREQEEQEAQEEQGVAYEEQEVAEDDEEEEHWSTALEQKEEEKDPTEDDQTAEEGDVESSCLLPESGSLASSPACLLPESGSLASSPAPSPCSALLSTVSAQAPHTGRRVRQLKRLGGVTPGRSQARRSLATATAARSRAAGEVACLPDRRRTEEVLEEHKGRVTRYQRTSASIWETRSQGTKRVATTRIRPFSFQRREDQHLERRAARVRRGLESQQQRPGGLRAQPVPRFVDRGGSLPARQVLAVTQPSPFLLEGSRRLERREAARLEGVARQEERERRENQFRASEARVLQLQPFVPRPQEREAVTVPQGPSLRTDQRGEERKDFELRRMRNEAMAELEKRRAEEVRRREEEDSVARSRKESVHRARPVPNYRRLEVLPSSRAATVAVSPCLMTKRTADKRTASK